MNHQGSPLQVALMVKNLPMQEMVGNSSILGSGRSPGGEHGNPLQYSCLENPMDKGAWWATPHRVAKSQTGLKQLSMYCFLAPWLGSSWVPMWEHILAPAAKPACWWVSRGASRALVFMLLQMDHFGEKTSLTWLMALLAPARMVGLTFGSL